MADTKISPRQRLLFLGTSTADQTVVCITQLQTSNQSNEINADSFCGDDSLPGTQSSTITVNAQVLESPSNNKASYKQCFDWWQGRTALKFKISRTTASAGDIEETGDCFIESISTSDDLNAVTTFTMQIKVDGAKTVSTHS